MSSFRSTVFHHSPPDTFWWPNNPGHVLVVPNVHVENIYDLVPGIAVHVHEAARQVALAM